MLLEKPLTTASATAIVSTTGMAIMAAMMITPKTMLPMLSPMLTKE